MATQLQLRRGTTAENDVFTGAVGELTMDTDTNGLRIHDGNTTGGFEVPVLVAVQRPTADNNYTWYRKYSDGWVEQGGRLTGSMSSGFNTVTLLVEMQDNNYTVFATNISTYTEGTGSSHAYVMAKAGVVNSLTTTSIGVFSQNSGERYSWQVSGMGA